MEDYKLDTVKKNILITGGAGFIGSNLVKSLLDDDRIQLIRVVDNLSNGYQENVDPFIDHPKFEFLKKDIRDFDSMLEATKGIDVISHQAALGSVPRSIENPLLSNEVNVNGTLNVLYAAVKNNIKRVVLAFSSSTYGDSKTLPKTEDVIGSPLSPYAVTKYANELYADVFNKAYGLDYIGLRYFNVFGPNQNPNNPYAAVIPLFCRAFLNEEVPSIFGDGKTTRDFTFVDNAVLANTKAMFTTNTSALNNVYNVACGEQISLNGIIDVLNEITGQNVVPNYKAERPGDIKHSLADISKIQKLLDYEPTVSVRHGLNKVFQWYKEKYS